MFLLYIFIRAMWKFTVMVMVMNMTKGDSPNYLVKETQRRIENEENVNVSGKWKIYAEAIINECQKCKKWTVHGRCCKRDSGKM